MARRFKQVDYQSSGVTTNSQPVRNVEWKKLGMAMTMGVVCEGAEGNGGHVTEI